MSKATVLKCDTCGRWDDVNVNVRTVSVTGPRLDLCTLCRAHILVLVGVAKELAARYHYMVDQRVPVRGNYPQLLTAQKWVPDYPGQVTRLMGEIDSTEFLCGTLSQRPLNDETPGDEIPEPVGDMDVPEEETDVKPSPGRKRVPASQ